MQGIRVEFELVQTLQQGLVGQDCIAQSHAHVAQHRAVRQVALPAADGQFFTQVAQHGIGQAEVAFGVFKINRVDLVWHGGRANFTGLQTLFEITQ